MGGMDWIMATGLQNEPIVDFVQQANPKRLGVCEAKPEWVV